MELPSQAVTIYIGDSNQPKFVTVTANRILHTPAHPTPNDNPYASKGSKIAQVALNLSNRIDPRTELPIVDEREKVSKSWALELSLVNPQTGEGLTEHRKIFRRSDLKAPYSEIRESDSLTGSKAGDAMAELTEILRNRLKETATRTEEIFRARQSMSNEPRLLRSFDGTSHAERPHLSEKFLNDHDVRMLQKGLCGCESIFPEAMEVKRKLTAPESPVRVWPKNGAGARKISSGDLSCGMV